MAKLRAVQSGDDHLNVLDDNMLSCKGDRHDFPKLRVGPLNRNIKAKHVKNGVYQLTYVCPDCGTRRTKTTLKGGIVVTAKYDYDHPPGYLAPPGAGLTKADYARELGTREAPHVRAAGHGGTVKAAGGRRQAPQGSTA